MASKTFKKGDAQVIGLKSLSETGLFTLGTGVMPAHFMLQARNVTERETSLKNFQQWLK